MSQVRLDIISIGTLSRNRLWNETAAMRTAHATTTLVRAGKRNILVDPGLPPPALAARLFERTGLKPAQIDTVFLTNFRAAHRGGISLFENADILMHETELFSAKLKVGETLQQLIRDESDDQKFYEYERTILEACQPAPDKLTDLVDLFPLFGYTPGQCGLLISSTMSTTLIAGDAVPTLENFLAGQVLPDAADIKAAQEAMAEVYEIADIIVPGHDNVFVNPRNQGLG